jgi:hypothetical protein
MELGCAFSSRQFGRRPPQCTESAKPRPMKCPFTEPTIDRLIHRAPAGAPKTNLATHRGFVSGFGWKSPASS